MSLWPQIQTSRCWVNAHCAYINNFTGQLFTYFLPVYLSNVHGYNQVEISYEFAHQNDGFILKMTIRC